MAKSGPITAEDGCTFWSDGHLCERGMRHCDQCMCKCGHRWNRVGEQVELGTVTLTFNAAPSDELAEAVYAWIKRQRPGR